MMAVAPRSPSGRIGLFAASLITVVAVPRVTSGQVLEVGPAARFATIGQALEAARPGDTVLVRPGTYAERLRIEFPVTLLGEGWPVVDGGGKGHVIEALAPLTLEGFVVRGSGAGVEEEHAGVMVRQGPESRIEGNRFEDVFYGVYLKGSPRSVVRRNEIEGKSFPPPRRGDGIRLWYSSGSRVLDNLVRHTRDVVIYFSDSLLVRGNRIMDGRYGLHYMYSNHNRFERNRFEGNEVGAFLMYSAEIELRQNVFANSTGLTGMGLGLKDADAIEAVDNLVVGNEIGIHLDNSPRSREDRNAFTDNLLLGNGVGVRLLPSVQGNRFSGNEFVDNGSPVIVAGGAGPGQAARNDWSSNHWSGYAGFDREGDGRGDTPYVHARLADDLLSRHRELGLFARSPALGVLELVSRFFPLLKPEPVVIDSAPRIEGVLLGRWADGEGRLADRETVEGRAAGVQTRPGPNVWATASWLVLATAAVGALWRVARRSRS